MSQKINNFYFSSDGLEKNRTWTRIYMESMFYPFPSNRTKNTKVVIFCDTAYKSRQISKRGSTSAALNSALKTPFALHNLNRLDIRIHQVPSKIYHISKKQLSKSGLSANFFGVFFVITEVGSPDFIVKSAIFKI